jgi:hypothetical protein
LQTEAAPPSGGTATFQGINGTVSNLTTITGAFTDTANNVTIFTTTLLQANCSCPILHLELGPLDLNLLRLVVHLDRVVLDTTAQVGSGNLLGNLLCAVAHLLDSNAAGNALANLLNQLLGLLG